MILSYRDPLATRIALLAIALGIAARGWAYAGRGSLGLDEASLALNILGRGIGDLARPLDWGQAAPVGFLWLERALVVAMGAHEWVLRFWPFVAGVLVVPLTWRVGRRVVGDRGAALATVAIAASLLAIRYSTEAKPYATDAFIALVLASLALDVRDDPGTMRRWAYLGAAGVWAILFSLPAVFVLGGVALALFPVVRAADRGVRQAALATGIAWGMIFTALWFVVYRHEAGDPYLKEYWSPVMLGAGAKDSGARLLRAAASVASVPLQWTASIMVAFGGMDAWLAGLVVIGRKNRSNALLLGGPALLAAIASVVGVYPSRTAWRSSPRPSRSWPKASRRCGSSSARAGS